MSYNGIVVLNKPQGPTSHDMINRLRKIFGTKRVGHTGTLDPMAEGVLVVCIGNATKASDMILNEKKEYIAGIKFGVSTDTGDITGTIVKTDDTSIDAEALESTLVKLKGDLMQVPPMYSAKKVNGKKLYELARIGETIHREPAKITIYEAQVLESVACEKNTFKIKVVCSKGTYIRTYCEDVAKYLNTVGCMSSLVRTASGKFSVDKSYTIEDLEDLASDGELSKALIPTDELFDYAKVELSKKQSDRFKNGVFVSHPLVVDGEYYRVYDSDKNFIAVAVCIEGRLRIKKSFPV